MKSAEERLKAMEQISLDLNAKLPIRIWVEGDGKIYGEFQGNGAHRRHLTAFDAIKLIHEAALASNRIISC